MEPYLNIFPLAQSPATPVFALLALMGCAFLYCGLFQFGYSLIIQKIYYSTTGMGHLSRTFFYCMLINFPIILLFVFGLLLNNSALCYEVSLITDEAQILLVAGYICYVEESRQTPIKGFSFIRDCVFLIVGLAFLGVLYFDGVYSYNYVVMVGVLFLFYYLVQSFSDEIESLFLLLLRISEEDCFNAKFLLTAKSSPCSFLDTRDTIKEHSQAIREEVEDFGRINNSLTKVEEEKRVLNNFAKLFIPLKRACEINEEKEGKDCEKEFTAIIEKYFAEDYGEDSGR